MATGIARGQCALVTKRALEAAKGGKRNAALVRLVVVVKQVAGHVPNDAAKPWSRHQAVPLDGHPDFSIAPP
jgi:hypothetical protein